MKQLGAIPGGAFYALRGAWILPLLLSVTWWRERPFALAALVLAVLIAMLPGMFVEDISRSMAFAFPAELISVRELDKQNHPRTGDCLFLSLLLNVFTPQYQVVSKTFWICWPLPMALIGWFFKS